MEKQTNNSNDYYAYANIIASIMLDMIKDLSIIEKVNYVNNELNESNANEYIKNIVKFNVIEEIIDALPEEDRLNYINNELTEWNEEIKNILRKNIKKDKKENTNTNKNTNTKETDKLTNLIVDYDNYYDKDPIDELTNLIEILEKEIKPNMDKKYKYKTTNIKTKYKNGLNYGFGIDLFNRSFGDLNNILYIGIITDINNKQTNLKDINNKLRYFGWSKERNTINNIDKIITHLKNCKIELELIDKEIMIERRIESEIYSNKNIISKILTNSYKKTKQYFKDYNNTDDNIIKEIRSFIKCRLTGYKKHLEKQYNSKNIILDLYKICYVSRCIITEIIMEYMKSTRNIDNNTEKMIDNWYGEFERQLSKEIISFKKKNINDITIQNIKTKEILIFNNINDIANYLNVSKQSIYNLISGKTKSCKNWKLIVWSLYGL